MPHRGLRDHMGGRI